MTEVATNESPRRGRPKRPTARPAMRNVSAQLPQDEADAFYDLCYAVGTTGASVLRRAAMEFMAEHQHEMSREQRELPLTG